MTHLQDFLCPASNIYRLATCVQGKGCVTSPDVTQELVTLLRSPPQEPVPHGGMEAHECPVSPEHQHISNGLIMLPELSFARSFEAK